MTDQASEIRPETINRLQESVDSALAMLAGMQLDVFSPMKGGAMTLEQVSEAIDVKPMKLRPLMYALAVAGLLNLEGDKFSNTPEADQFLVKGTPGYMGGTHTRLSYVWESTLKTAASIRTGIPQARLDFSGQSEEELEEFLRSIQPQAMIAGRALADRRDLSSFHTLADIG